MRKYLIFGLLAIMLATSTGMAFAAKPDFQAVNAGPSKGKATVAIPAKAVEVTPGIFSLGTAYDPGSGQMVQGYAIVRYKKGFGKPAWAGGKDKNSTQCYTYLAKDAKWKTIEDWMVNPANSGLAQDFVASNLAADIAKWEDAASADILGDEIANDVDGADTVTPDNKNEVYFADIEDPNAIAVTIIWGIFGGRPSNRMLVEWDQVYDNVQFSWSDNGQADKMDFENIATHELGHSVGMGDLYEPACAEETMYGYASNGETKKRDLNSGDIEGVSKLYK